LTRAGGLGISVGVRPTLLNPLFSDLTSLPGIGAHLGKLLTELCGPLVVDLLWHLPSGLVQRQRLDSLAAARPDQIVMVPVTVAMHHPPASPRRPWRVECHDADGRVLSLVYFHAKGDYLLRQLPAFSVKMVSGKLEQFNDHWQITHPDTIWDLPAAPAQSTIEPVYPLTAGVSVKQISRFVTLALERAPDLPEWLDGELMRRRGWPAWSAALAQVHRPQTLSDLAPDHPARLRLAYDEILANQLALILVRQHLRSLTGRGLISDGRFRQPILDHLPWSLTGSQRQAVEDILADLAADRRMLRLLQGDVGSGKTIVALLAMAAAVEAGCQAALMAPTEILARQHAETITPLAAAAGLRIAVLTGRDKGKARAALLERLAAGEIDILIGTHAVFQEDVQFRDLALVVIDEQHRFGVHQRLMLAAKGKAVDVLVMTATPIPRTLLLSAYGDMDVSRLTEKPAGRQPIDTRALPLDRLEEVMHSLRRAVASGARIYWVCPLVEESEAIDLAAATDRHVALRDLLGERVGLIHGRMKGPEKDKVMAAFAAGDLDVLVATTVIEVGVNVPEATIMIIEHAERFGLAQLHQLRGRIGRGSKASSCLLLYQGPLGETAKARLNIMRESEDGFRIAEEDLRLRGAGEVLGTRQSGIAEFRLADVGQTSALVEMARDDAKLIVARDSELESERGRALRTLLYLFQRDVAARYLRSG